MNYLDRLKEELDSTAEWNPTVTVSRKDLENLIKAFDKLLGEDDE